jgi:parallel beta-helix repeat protein
LNDYYGIYLYDSSGNTIVKNSISGNIGYGLHLTGYLLFSNSNRIWSNSFMYNNGAGDTFDPAHVQAYDDGSDNWWNSTDGYGNWWSDWRAPDDNWDGIVDNPYNISGSAGAKDYYPQTVPGTPIPEFGMMPLIMMVFVMAIVLTIGARRRKEH